MSSAQYPDRHRPRRPRFEPDDYEDSESDDRPSERRRPVRSSREQRPPPPPEDFDRPSRRGPPVPVDARDDFAPPPEERPRAKSKVRLKEPSDSEDSDNTYRKRHRRPRGERADLERKTSPEHTMFRSKRDGYLSDEGEALRKDRRRPREDPRPRRERDGSDNDARGPRRDRLDPAAGAGRSSRAKSMEPPPPYPSGSGGRGDERGHRRADYDTDPDGPSRRHTTREPRERPREARPRYDDYDDAPPPRRRGDDYRPRGGHSDDRDRGYRSDHGGRSRRDDDYRRPERDPYDRRSRGDGYRSDHGPSRRDVYDDPRDSARRRDKYSDPRRDYGDDRRVDDRRDRHRSTRGSSSKKKGGMLGNLHLDEDWQRGATTMFMQYGLPILKKEGPKWARQAQGYLAKRGGA